MKKPKSLINLSFLFSVILLLNACGNSPQDESYEESPEYLDSAGVEIEFETDETEKSVYLDTAVYVPDTLPIPPIEVNPSLKSATLGYSYPSSLSKREIGDVNVQVEIKNPNSTIRAQLVEVLISQSKGHNPKGDSILIYSESIPFYNELDISLSDDAKDFELSAKHLNNTQAIDSVSGNSWHWTIIPVTDKKTAQLMLKVVAKDINGNSKVFEPKRIFISIKLDNETGFRRIINYLWDNPAVSIPILISFFGFIGFLIRRKLTKANPDG